MGELSRRVHFWRTTDRIGPDIPWTHWRLLFPTAMRRLCLRRFAGFGEGADFRPGAYAVGCSRISIGSRVVVRPGSQLHADTREGGAGITIEDDVLLGGGVHIYVDKHVFDDPARPIIEQGYVASRRVVLKRGCWIGANAIILPGVTIGENAVVGAGSVVTRDVASRTVVVGSPARVIRDVGSLASGEPLGEQHLDNAEVER
jgi:acetyltransferase-like isoleucine patch superfamily enzyme